MILTIDLICGVMLGFEIVEDEEENATCYVIDFFILRFMCIRGENI